jgi:hypothetical protein
MHDTESCGEQPLRWDSDLGTILPVLRHDDANGTTLLSRGQICWAIISNTTTFRVLPGY